MRFSPHKPGTKIPGCPRKQGITIFFGFEPPTLRVGRLLVSITGSSVWCMSCGLAPGTWNCEIPIGSQGFRTKGTPWNPSIKSTHTASSRDFSENLDSDLTPAGYSHWFLTERFGICFSYSYFLLVFHRLYMLLLLRVTNKRSTRYNQLFWKKPGKDLFWRFLILKFMIFCYHE